MKKLVFLFAFLLVGVAAAAPTVVSTTETSATIGGLACGSKYRFEIRKYNADGSLSSTSSSLDAQTKSCPDTQPPSAPQNLATTGATQTSISVSWSPSTDDVGVTGYDLYRGGAKIDSASATSYTFGGLSCGTSYSLAVEAHDASGKRSAASAITASTAACPPPSCPTGEYTAQYYGNMTLSGTPVLQRCETAINHDWGSGSPGGTVPADRFSTRWTRKSSLAAGTYQFTATADDGIRVWVDSALLIDSWKDQPATTYQATRTLTAGDHDVKVEYYENGEGAVARVSWQLNQPPPPPPPSSCPAGQYSAQYFGGTTLSGTPALQRCEAAINHDWGLGSPGAGVPTDRFSTRWTGKPSFTAGTYQFTATADDGIRVWVDGTPVIDAWKEQAPTTYQATRILAAGEHAVKVEYYENSGGAVARLSWRKVADPSPTDETAALQTLVDSTPDGGTVTLEPRVYNANGTIRVENRRNLTIAGAGATIRSSSPGDGNRPNLTIRGGSGNVVRGLTIEGGYATPGQHNVDLQWSHGINIAGAQGTLVENVAIRNVAGDCVLALAQFEELGGPRARDTIVRNVTCAGAGRNGVALTSADNSRVEGGSYSNVGWSVFDVEPEAAFGDGVNGAVFDGAVAGDYAGHTVAGVVGDAQADNITFSNLQITASKGGVIQVATPTARRRSNIAITDNVATNTAYINDPLGVQRTDGLTVRGNTIPANGVLLICTDATGLVFHSNVPNTSAGCSAPERPYQGRAGISSHLIWRPADEVRRELGRIRAGGVTWIREDFAWAAIEPQPGAYDWSYTDKLMEAAALNGINVLPVLGYSTPWASSGSDNFYPPKDFQVYAQYAARVVGRYGRKGTFWTNHPELTPRPLLAVEVWNEPYGWWFWKPEPNPAAYARMVRATASAVRAVDPQVTVIISGELRTRRSDGAPGYWIRQLLAADPTINQVADAYAVHPYSAGGPYNDIDPEWGYKRVQLVHEIDPTLPIWITEVGWTTATETPYGVTETTQADYYRGAVKRATDEWGSFVPITFLYSWDRSNGVPTDAEGNYGLRRADNSLKPAWEAITGLVATGR